MRKRNRIHESRALLARKRAGVGAVRLLHPEPGGLIAGTAQQQCAPIRRLVGGDRADLRVSTAVSASGLRTSASWPVSCAESVYGSIVARVKMAREHVMLEPCAARGVSRDVPANWAAARGKSEKGAIAWDGSGGASVA